MESIFQANTWRNCFVAVATEANKKHFQLSEKVLMWRKVQTIGNNQNFFDLLFYTIVYSPKLTLSAKVTLYLDSVFLAPPRELQVPKELGVHSLHLDPGLGRGLLGRELVGLLAGVILKKTWPSSIRDNCPTENLEGQRITRYFFRPALIGCFEKWTWKASCHFFLTTSELLIFECHGDKTRRLAGLAE